jgi:O-antigen ligase
MSAPEGTMTRPRRVQLALPQQSAAERHSGPAMACFCLFLALLAWAPLPFGSARPWAWGVIGAVLVVLLIATPFALSDATRPNAEGPRQRLWPILPSAALYGLALTWAIFQTATWSPAEWHHPLWEFASTALGGLLSTSISLDPPASRLGVFHLISYAGMFFLAFLFGKSSARARSAVKFVSITAALYATYGLLVFLAGNSRILIFEKFAYPGDLTSTFVNRNSFATYTGIGLVATLGLLFEQITERIRGSQSLRGIAGECIEFAVTKGRVRLLSTLVLIAALLLTHSRGGSLSTAAGIVAFFVLARATPGGRSAWRGLAVVVIVLMVPIFFAASGGELDARWAATTATSDPRVTIFADTLRAIADQPLLGTGLGTFRDVFTYYQSEDLPYYVDLGHNDYLENLLELGAPAASALYLALLLLVGWCVKGALTRRRDAVFASVAAAASVVMGVHSLFDFSAQIPAVTLTWCALLGIGAAQSERSDRSSGARSAALPAPPGRNPEAAV